MSITRLEQPTTPSALVAREIRAEMGRQGVNQSEMARRMGQNSVWVSARIGRTSSVPLRIEDVVEMAKALGVSPQGFLSPLLPRLDSNQQPSGYQSVQVRDTCWCEYSPCICGSGQTAEVLDLFTREQVA